MGILGSVFSILIFSTNSQALLDCAQLRIAQERELPRAQLPPLIAIPKAKLAAINCGEAALPVNSCEELPVRLAAYAENVKTHEETLLAYVQDVQSAALTWYDDLCPLENTAQSIPFGYFSVLLTGANDLNDVSDLAARNHNCLKKDLAEIVKAASSLNCKSF